MMQSLLAATLNLRNLADRWDERLPLLLADTAALRPDVLALQEVVFVLQQDRLLGAGTPDEYGIHRAWAGRPEYGNSLLIAGRSRPATMGAGTWTSAARRGESSSSSMATRRCSPS